MNADYADKLQILRRAFGPTSETPLLTAVVLEHFSGRVSSASDAQPTITMLDIGIGNGAATRSMLSDLRRHGIQTSLTGIDLYIPEPAHSPVWDFRPRLIATRFEDFRTNETYDVVNATHSLYYLENQVEALRRMVSLVSPEGLLTITIWADGCTLKAVHDRYLALNCCSLSAGQLTTTLRRSVFPACHVKEYYFDGVIRLTTPHDASGAARAAILDIARRNAPVSPAANASAIEYLDSLGQIVPRRNVIIVAVPVGGATEIRE